jgi:hypothetical protein
LYAIFYLSQLGYTKHTTRQAKWQANNLGTVALSLFLVTPQSDNSPESTTSP